MPNLTDAKYCKELGEEELGKISGGAVVDINSGTYSAKCPFCGQTFSVTIGATQQMSTYKVIGTCQGTINGAPCAASISFKNSSWATFTKCGDTREIQWSHSNC